jgi:hypothetical protein
MTENNLQKSIIMQSDVSSLTHSHSNFVANKVLDTRLLILEFNQQILPV